jgi:putative tryptophan/tyrosine transport system substrate-binding protein
MKRRREFIAGLAGAVAWPLAARAQQGERMRRIGFWVGEPETDPNAQRRVTAFKQGLAELAWIEGRTVQIEYRWPIIDGKQVRADAESLIALAPDVIVTTGAPTVAVFKRLTRTIPIVFTFVTDPVLDGLVETLAHPGGNITGFTIFEHTMAGKWVEMLKEVCSRCDARCGDAESRAPGLDHISECYHRGSVVSRRCSHASPRARR